MSHIPRVKLKPTAPAALRELFLGVEDAIISVDGALATIEQYESFELNPCHLMPDGRIMRFGVQIATVDDIEIEDMP